MNFKHRFSGKIVFLQSYLLFLLLQFLFLPVASLALPGQNKRVDEKLKLVRLNQEFLHRLRSKLELGQQHKVFLKKIRDYSAGEKIVAFLEALDDAKAQGYDTREYLNSISQQRQAAMKALNIGSISGKVTGNEWSSAVETLVFDRYGFFVGSAETNRASRSWLISDLPKGDYYIVARGHPENGWKGSELVSVEASKGASGVHIDFSEDIEPEFNSNSKTLLTDDASIKGTVTGQDELSLGFAFVFVFDLADTSIAGFTVSDFDSGSFSIDSLAAGSYVGYADSYLNLSVQVDDTTTIGTLPHLGEYYDNAATPDQATPITLAQSEVRAGVDFSLESGGAISGRINDETGAPLDSMFIIAVKIDLDNPSKFITEKIDLSMTSSDAQGDYTLIGLSSGDYIVRTISFINPNLLALFEGALGKHAGIIIDEYFSGVQNLFSFGEATPVTVNEPDTTKNINFSLALAGAISGNFIEFAGGAPVQGEGVVVAFNAETGLPELAVDFDTSAASYEIRPLPQGDFKLLGIVDSDNVTYLPQFYNLKDFENADLVSVNPPNTTENKNFTMVRPGKISGVVSLPTSSSLTLGKQETELDILLLAFDATSGEVAGETEADSFTLQYSITGLAPGSYLVEALPATQGLAATYHGGGISFDDANSVAVTVASDATSQADVTLLTGEGIISGTVTDLDGNPLAGILVIAYDETGHAVSGGVSGLDDVTEELDPNSGDFMIPGLAAGNYFVRTFSFFRFLSLADDLDDDSDPLTLILGLLLGQADLGDVLDGQFFADAWYPNQIIEIDLESSNLVDLFFGLLFSDGDIQSLLPFFDIVPGGATTVTVSSPGQRSEINFALPALDLSGILTDVEELPATGIPASFQLFQNYPNPFNPNTVITFSVPRTAEVQISIHNILGQRIKTLFEGHKETGVHTVQWNGLDDGGVQVAAGFYLMRMESGNQTLSRKMLLVK